MKSGSKQWNYNTSGHEAKKNAQEELKVAKDKYGKMYTLAKTFNLQLHELDRQIKKEQIVEESKAARDAYLNKKRYLQQLQADTTESLEAEGKYLQARFNELFGTTEATVGTLSSGVRSITSKLDNTIDNYVKRITSMRAQLQGSMKDFETIEKNISSTLGSAGLVKQEAVYTKLYDLIDKGIIYNVEQRAFLATLSADINLMFDATNGTLLRLIRIQQADVTANKMTMQYSLQTILANTYQTTEYIKTKFTSVSDALLDMQSMMDTASGLNTEATIQSWLGAFYSGGVSGDTVSQLASALNAIGSGDISNLGSGIANLVLMGVARSGLDYGELLNNGLNANNAGKILSSVSDYVKSFQGYESNVVKNQLSKLFGISVSDISAMANVKNVNVAGSNPYGEGSLLNMYSSFVPAATQLTNTIDNLLYSTATGIASSPFQLGLYKTVDTLSQLTSGIKVGALGTQVDLGQAIKIAQIAPVMMSMIGTMGDLNQNWQHQEMTALNMFTKLGNAASSISSVTSQPGVSTSAAYYNTSQGDIAKQSLNTQQNQDAMQSVLPDEPTLEDNVTAITSDVAIIREIVEDTLKDIKTAVMTGPASRVAQAVAGVVYSNNSSPVYGGL